MKRAKSEKTAAWASGGASCPCRFAPFGMLNLSVKVIKVLCVSVIVVIVDLAVELLLMTRIEISNCYNYLQLSC